MTHLSRKKPALYGDRDPRDIPTYTAQEAARITGAGLSRLRAWAWGQTRGGAQSFRPVIQAGEDRGHVSFFGLAELHVLNALRFRHGVTLPKIRRAIDYFAELKGTAHPLLDLTLLTDGVEIFVDHLGHLVGGSSRGQVAMRKVLEAHLQRLERDEHGVHSLYPFTRIHPKDAIPLDEPKYVVVTPRVAFGQPVITGTRIRTSVIAERFHAGDAPDDLAKDYGRELIEIFEAIRCEGKAA